MENLKYALTRQQCESDSTYFRIVALKTFKRSDGIIVNAGDLGGMIQSPKNLSQDGSCWIDFNSLVCDNAMIDEDAVVVESDICNDAIITNSAIVYHSDIQDSVVIKNNATIKNSTIKGTVRVENVSMILNSYVSGSIVLKENATCEDTYLMDSSGKICGYSVISNSKLSGNLSFSSSCGLHNCTINSTLIIEDPIILKHIQLSTKQVTLNIEYATDLITIPTWWDPDTDFITYIPKLKQWNFEDELVDSKTLISLAEEHYSSFVVDRYKKLVELTCGIL